MKLIVAGGRDYALGLNDLILIKGIFSKHKVTMLVHGGCRGVDQIAGAWFKKQYGIEPKVFPANWNLLGKAAGPVRNQQMIDYADGLVLFPGNRGTANIREKALEKQKTHPNFLVIEISKERDVRYLKNTEQ